MDSRHSGLTKPRPARGALVRLPIAPGGIYRGEAQGAPAAAVRLYSYYLVQDRRTGNTTHTSHQDATCTQDAGENMNTE